MSKFIGIDLGTTFSAVAQVDETGRATIIHNEDGVNITPSVVSFEGSTVLVGEEARKVLGLDPNTIGRFKRDMGTEKTYALGGAERTPTFLSSLVLKKLKQFVEDIIGPFSDAVVTVPANFANDAREATLIAARDAGLKVEHIINEPTAAALYYAAQSGEILNGRYAIYDLGGGTFDVSIIQAEHANTKVLSTNGVSLLGGDDFDEALLNLVKEKAKEKTGTDLSNDIFNKNDAEQLKITLSKRDLAKVRIPGVANIEVSRNEFEDLISSLVAQAELLCESCLDDAGLTFEDINEVFLVGGSTRVPSVMESVKRVFKKDPKSTANVDEVVALGAALYAQYKLGEAKKINHIQEITSKSYGTYAQIPSVSGQLELANSVVIKRGSEIPCLKSESFTRTQDQKRVKCEVTEAESDTDEIKFVNVIWEDAFEDLPTGKSQKPEIRVTYEYTENQTMKCWFLDVESGQEIKHDININAPTSNDKNQPAPSDFKIE